MKKFFAFNLAFFLMWVALPAISKDYNWKRCLGKNDLTSSWSSKPAYCYNKKTLKLYSEKEIKKKIVNLEDAVNSVRSKIKSLKYKVVVSETFTNKFKFKKRKKNIVGYEYFLPSEPFWEAFTNSMEIKNGHLIMTIKPGTRQSLNNKPNRTERAEWGFFAINGNKLIKRDKFLRLSYKFKLPTNSADLFIKEPRILISQLKIDGGKYPGFSPVSAFYVNKGGAATCVDYNKQRSSKDLIINNHTKIPDEIDIYDGKWHRLEFLLRLSKNDGYCLVKIDGKKIVEKIKYDNDLNPSEELVVRFGPYRDETFNTQTIYYDNIELGYFY